MIFAGCDVGSLTAKAVLIEDNNIISSKIIGVKPTAIESATAVMTEAIAETGIEINDIDLCCSTGYGRFNNSFAHMNKTEISCHGLGAFWLDNSIRTIIDIGGQDCKVISIDEDGMINDFIMNEKCAAGTGRSLEILSRTIGLGLMELGEFSLKSKNSIEISNKCSIFMELDVIQHLYQKADKCDIACAINKAVAKRIFQLVKSLGIRNEICITGGVAKNIGVVEFLKELLGVDFKILSEDPQLTGAIGAAVFASQKKLVNKRMVSMSA